MNHNNIDYHAITHWQIEKIEANIKSLKEKIQYLTEQAKILKDKVLYEDSSHREENYLELLCSISPD